MEHPDIYGILASFTGDQVCCNCNTCKSVQMLVSELTQSIKNGDEIVDNIQRHGSIGLDALDVIVKLDRLKKFQNHEHTIIETARLLIGK